jgi:hypothetical protein
MIAPDHHKWPPQPSQFLGKVSNADARAPYPFVGMVYDVSKVGKRLPSRNEIADRAWAAARAARGFLCKIKWAAKECNPVSLAGHILPPLPEPARIAQEAASHRDTEAGWNNQIVKQAKMENLFNWPTS